MKQLLLVVTGTLAAVLVARPAEVSSWQRIQMPTAAQTAKAWLNPPPEYGPEPYYGLNGAVTEAVVTRDLDRLHALGFQAVTVQAGFGMPFEYLSPKYFQFFKLFAAEAKKRDMRVWIVDDAGYPSGFAGGKFTTLKPELRMQVLSIAKKLKVNGGEVIKQAVSPETVAVTAIKITDGSAVQIPVRDSSIEWTAPDGAWQMTVVEHQFRTSPTRSDTNKNRVKDTSQSLEDYLDPAATRQYLEFTHEQYKRAVGNEFGKTIMGFRGDEPDYSINGLPWTPAFFDHFQQLKGYDVKPYVAAFFVPRPPEKAPVMTEAQKRAKADYWDVFSILFRDGFYKVQGDWCAANHLEYQVHLNHEEMEMQLTRSEGEFFRDMRPVQVPGIDSIWHQIWTDTISDFPRLASSAAHVYGKPRAFTETFAAYRPAPDLETARYILNEQFVRGVNLVEIMYFPASTGQPRPPAPFMTDAGFPKLMGYTRRLSYLMSMGRPDASVALYLPSSSMWLGEDESDKAFVSAERMLSEHQIDFDIVDEDALAKDLRLGEGSMETASGNRFRTIIVPGAVVLSEAALTRLRSFAKGGGKVLFLGCAPSLICSRTYLDARSATAGDFSWAKVVTESLPVTPTPPANPPAAAPAALLIPPAMLEALNESAPLRDLTLDKPDTSFRYMRRRLKDADVYLIFNEGAANSSHEVALMSAGKKVEEWNPEDGTVLPAASVGSSGKLQIHMDLRPYETKVVVVRAF